MFDYRLNLPSFQRLWACNGLLHPSFYLKDRCLSLTSRTKAAFPMKSPTIASPREELYICQEPHSVKDHWTNLPSSVGVQDGEPQVSSNHLCSQLSRFWESSWSFISQMKKFNYRLSGLYRLILKGLNKCVLYLVSCTACENPLQTSGRRPSRGKAGASNDGNM